MKIYCSIEPFAQEQEVFLVNDEDYIITQLGKMTIPSLLTFIPEYCYQNNIDTISLRGQKDYLNGLIVGPLAVSATEYKMNLKIEIEDV